jgi:hypothetical protein
MVNASAPVQHRTQIAPRKPLKMKLTKILLNLTSAALACLSLTGCEQLDDVDVAYADDFRGFEPVEAWDSVVCSAGTRCYAHTPSAAELWMPVVSWCSLEDQLESGEFFFETGTWQYLCNIGGSPVSFDDFRCFATSGVSTRCYGGSDGWYTQVEPTCVTAAYNTAAWGAGSCDSDDFYGETTFDSVNIRPTKIDRARATESTDAFYAVPYCSLPSGMSAAPDPFAC